MEVIDTRIELITPFKAKAMLEKNTGNRTISETVVLRLADAMSSGDFICTNNGIGIDETGNLIDGQHRLAAIIKSGVSIKMVVCTYEGKTTAKYIPIDCGKKRSLSDFTGLNKQSAAIVAFCVRYIYGSKNTNGDTKRFIEGLGNRIDLLTNLSQIHKKYISVSILTAFFILRLKGIDKTSILEEMVSLNFISEESSKIFKTSMEKGCDGATAKKELFFCVWNQIVTKQGRVTEKLREQILTECREMVSNIINKAQ